MAQTCSSQMFWASSICQSWKKKAKQREKKSACYVVTSKMLHRDKVGWNVLSSPSSGWFLECPEPKISTEATTTPPPHTHTHTLSHQYQTVGKTMSHTNVCTLRVFRQPHVQNPLLQTRIDPVKPRLEGKLQSFSFSVYLFLPLSLFLQKMMQITVVLQQ